MKNAKLVFGLLMLTVFSLSFVLNNNSNDEDKGNAIQKSYKKLPTNG